MTTTHPTPPDNRLDGAVHEWFELSYSNYLVLPRTLMQSMPEQWQERMVACLREIEQVYRATPQADGYEVRAGSWTYINELDDDGLRRAGVTWTEAPDPEDSDADDPWMVRTYNWRGREVEPEEYVFVPGHDPVPHYNRGRTYLPPV